MTQPSDGTIECSRFSADLYPDLKRLASSYLRRYPTSSSLDPTLLVHESIVRLLGDAQTKPNNRDHFLALLATIMRNILVDHARKQNSRRRWRASVKANTPISSRIDDQRLLDLDHALTGLAARHPRQAQVVELRIFGGQSLSWIADHLSIARRTAELDWRMAKIWLKLSINTEIE